jgi:hypothetical protein
VNGKHSAVQRGRSASGQIIPGICGSLAHGLAWLASRCGPAPGRRSGGVTSERAPDGLGRAASRCGDNRTDCSGVTGKKVRLRKGGTPIGGKDIYWHVLGASAEG